MQLTRNNPAKRFGEAFALGNGHMGEMVYGGIDEERIDISELTFFSGNRSDNDDRLGAARVFRKMRKAACEEDYPKLHKLAEDFVGVRNNYGTNLPVGVMKIKTGLKGESAREYERSLDLRRGTVSSSWISQGKNISTTAFSSHVRNVFCYEIKAEDKMLNLELTFTSPRDGKDEYVRYSSDSVYFETKACETMHSDGTSGTFLVGKAIIRSDGYPSVNEDSLKLKNASFMQIIFMMETDFKEEEKANKLQLQCMVNRRLLSLDKCSFEKLQKEHEEDMISLFDRVSIEINGDEYAHEVPLLFQMGRYLLYSSSREDSSLPTHLQGVWNDNVACRIGWTCDMHLDINTQMNYWPAEVTGISEVTKPLFAWIVDSLAVNGRKTAKESYGYRGWVAELVSNAWGFTAPYWAVPLAPCPTGGVWILTHMWEHYMFTSDKEFLRKYAYPVIKESVKFFVDYVFEDENGFMSCGPSISPENSFVIDENSDEKFYLSNGCTYEIVMIRELFDIYLKACEVLHRENKLTDKVREYINKLLPYRVTDDGKLAEWNHDYPSADLQHRHTSHLLGVFPFAQITPENKELAEAAEKSLEEKLKPIEGWEDTGWARSMLMLYEARLKHPQKAWNHMTSMMEHLLEPNGFIIHPPTRGAAAFDNVYELDGNTGFTSCVAEMLLQSHNNGIQLFPCLPEEWESGHVNGLMARGGVIVDLAWDKDKKEAWLTAKKTGSYKISMNGKKRELSLKAGERFHVGS